MSRYHSRARLLIGLPVDSQTLLLSAYAFNMTLLAGYGVHRLLMLSKFKWPGQACSESPEPAASSEQLPHVTVQLPLFNERTVVSQLVRAAGAIRYPHDRFEIQILDDSTDETRDLVDAEAALLVEQGIDCTVVRRSDRTGFKAGALDYGMRQAKGELLCVFDADFIPAPDFLSELVHHFRDSKVGMVQARWGHSNRDESLLTRAQSTLLDGHFVIEHKVRHDRGLFFNFNGTAGIWRREAIDSAGGWQHDTLTEDLDLSYRAQLRGWNFVYAPLVVAPAEIPPTISSFKSQQHRWAKGSVQVLRKLAGEILRSDEPVRVKLEALAHLTGNIGYPAVLLLALLLPLSLGLHETVPQWLHFALFLLCSMSVVLFYERSQRALGRPLFSRLRDIIAAVTLGIGMCVSQTRAVLEGCRSSTGSFVRTPKRGDRARPSRTYTVSLKGLPGIELLLATWFAWAIVHAATNSLWGSIPFLLLFFVSFAWVGSLSLRDWVRGT